MSTYSVTIDVDVHDKRALYREARAKAKFDGLGSNLADLLGTAKKPDIGACLIMILDPGSSPDGTSIVESRVEHFA